MGVARDFAEKHATCESAHAKLRNTMRNAYEEHEVQQKRAAELQQRMDHIDGALVDSAEKHAKWETAHSQLTNLKRDVEQRIVPKHASLEERMNCVEHVFEDST